MCKLEQRAAADPRFRLIRSCVEPMALARDLYVRRGDGGFNTVWRSSHWRSRSWSCPVPMAAGAVDPWLTASRNWAFSTSAARGG